MVDPTPHESYQAHSICVSVIYTTATILRNYTCRMAYYKATHKFSPLSFVVFLILALQWCEGRVSSAEERSIFAHGATDRLGSLLGDATTVKPFLQSMIFNLLNLWAATGEKNQLQVDEEEPEKFFNTTGARFVYNAENQVEQEDENSPHLLMPFETSKCRTGNYIDDCWRCDANWQSRRQQLASCAVGFGSNAIGGKHGKLYVVTTNDDDRKNPAPGTLRYGVTRPEPLWITFASDMTIQLQGDLKMTSYKTIDGRGAEVHLVKTSQVTLQGVSNVIIHGIHVHDIERVEHQFEGDAIHIRDSRDIWIDHCYVSRAYDGLIDVTKNSTAVTISNNYFEHQNKVMLFGASREDDYNRDMQVTVAFNKFGTNLTQRMPRCRYGNFHVANNYYITGWNSYAIGGSEDPTILSQGNRFVASKKKEVTARIDDSGPTFGGWEKWDWISTGDSFANGSFFTGSGEQNASASNYDRAKSFVPRHASWVIAMTADAGPLNCVPRTTC